MSIVKQKSYILASLEGNMNKHWEVRLLADGSVISRWGRIGEPPHEKRLGSGEALFDAKCREKEKKGYVEQRTLSNAASHSGAAAPRALPTARLEQVATSQIAATSPAALALIKQLVKANVHQIMESTTLTYNAQTGLFSTPLGILTPDALAEARRVLATIGDAVARGAYGDPALAHAANRFLNLVPQHLKRGGNSLRDLYPDVLAVRRNNDLLDRLEASLKTALASPSDNGTPEAGVAAPKVFEASINLIEGRSEFHALNARFKSTLNRSHACSHLKLRRAYTVEIAAMQSAFEKRRGEINHVMELWHGTGTGNILSILKDGFRLKPPSTATLTGKMFGEGLYFALQSSKSLNYAHGYWSGTRHKTCYLFLCEVAVGRYQVPSGTTSQRPRNGYDSYWAKPGQTAGIVNDEIVVFDAAQINPKYLLEFSEG